MGVPIFSMKAALPDKRIGVMGNRYRVMGHQHNPTANDTQPKFLLLEQDIHNL
jgi:hypothetical protein